MSAYRSHREMTERKRSHSVELSPARTGASPSPARPTGIVHVPHPCAAGAAGSSQRDWKFQTGRFVDGRDRTTAAPAAGGGGFSSAASLRREKQLNLVSIACDTPATGARDPSQPHYSSARDLREKKRLCATGLYPAVSPNRSAARSEYSTRSAGASPSPHRMASLNAPASGAGKSVPAGQQAPATPATPPAYSPQPQPAAAPTKSPEAAPSQAPSQARSHAHSDYEAGGWSKWTPEGSNSHHLLSRQKHVCKRAFASPARGDANANANATPLVSSSTGEKLYASHSELQHAKRVGGVSMSPRRAAAETASGASTRATRRTLSHEELNRQIYFGQGIERGELGASAPVPPEAEQKRAGATVKRTPAVIFARDGTQYPPNTETPQPQVRDSGFRHHSHADLHREKQKALAAISTLRERGVGQAKPNAAASAPTASHAAGLPTPDPQRPQSLRYHPDPSGGAARRSPSANKPRPPGARRSVSQSKTSPAKPLQAAAPPAYVGLRGTRA